MVPRSHKRPTPRPHMSNNSMSLIVALPSRVGDPLHSPTTYMNSTSKVTPTSSRPRRRRSTHLAQPWLIPPSNTTTRGPIQRRKVSPPNCLEPPRILLACPLILGRLTLFQTMPAHSSRLYEGVSHPYMVSRTLFARSRCITPHQHTVRHPPMPHPKCLDPARLQVHQLYTNNTKTGQ